VAVGRGQFGSPGRVMFAIGSQYQSAGEEIGGRDDSVRVM
jgi:hypothetical protein